MIKSLLTKLIGVISTTLELINCKTLRNPKLFYHFLFPIEEIENGLTREIERITLLSLWIGTIIDKLGPYERRILDSNILFLKEWISLNN